MQSQANHGFKFIMVYQDHLTKFCLLQTLKTKTAEEVSYHLLDIFTTFGAPCILQSDNGREFSNRIIKELKLLWPNLKIIHGKPRHSQSQGSVERANQDIENMLATWLKDNDTKQWSDGIKFVQFMKNCALHAGIKMSPYKAMFRIEPRLSLSSLNIDAVTEEDIQGMFTDDEENMEEVEKTENPHKFEESLKMSENDSNILGKDFQKVKQSAATSRSQAKRMKQISDSSHPAAKIGDNVTVVIPDVDRSRGSL